MYLLAAPSHCLWFILHNALDENIIINIRVSGPCSSLTQSFPSKEFVIVMCFMLSHIFSGLTINVRCASPGPEQHFWRTMR